MGKVYYINGGVFASTGNLFTRNIFALDPICPEGAITITPPNGILEITENSGSIFDTYHVKDFVTASGIKVGNIFAFKDIYDYTIESYRHHRELLYQLFLNPPKEEQLRSVFYQQQYAHLFSLLELFLSNTFVKQTCDNEESYRRVLNSMILTSANIVRNSNKKILSGKDCLQKELLYIESIQNHIVYHRFKLISELFHIAFDIDIDFSDLSDPLNIRNDIIHRFGHSTKGADIKITEADVMSLFCIIDNHVYDIIKQLSLIASVDD